jgi:hypothetical protein
MSRTEVTKNETIGLDVGTSRIVTARQINNEIKYNTQLNEFLLMYDDVRSSASPCATLLNFCQSTYEAGAELAHWDRQALEKPTRASAGIA